MRELVRCLLASGNYNEAYELWRSRNLNTRPNIMLLNQKNYILKGKYSQTEKSIKYGNALSHKQGTTQG
jgi:hypothetical protein